MVSAPLSPAARAGKLVATRLDDAGAQVLRALMDRNPKVADSMIEDIGLGNVAGRVGVQLHRHRAEARRLSARGLLLPLQPPVRLEHGDAAPHRDGRSWSATSTAASRWASSAWGARSAAAAGPNRITTMNPKIAEQNDGAERDGPRPRPVLLGPLPRLHPELAVDPGDAADRAERRRGVRAEPRRARRLRRRQPRPAPTRAYEAGSLQGRGDRRSRSRSRSSTTTGNWVEQERGEKVLFDRDECIRPGTTAEKLAGLPAAARRQELRRQGARHHRRQLVPDQRRHLGRAADERGEGRSRSDSSRWRASSASPSAASSRS